MPFTRSMVGGGMFTLTISCTVNFVVELMDRLAGSTGAGNAIEGTSLFDSSSSLLGSSGKAGFIGMACSSFGLMENDTEAAGRGNCEKFITLDQNHTFEFEI